MEEIIYNLDDIGVVIPVFNEAELLPKLLLNLKRNGLTDIVLVDASSTDHTTKIANDSSVTLIHSKLKNRGYQLNLGGQSLNKPFLLFLHADVQFSYFNQNEILELINSPKFSFANFRLRFDSSHWFLKFNSLFSRLKNGAFQFGDQGLLVRKIYFEKHKGYKENLLFMEGNHIIRELRQETPFIKLKSTLFVSPRKYEQIGVFKLQFSYFAIYFLERLGVKQLTIKNLFNRVLN